MKTGHWVAMIVLFVVGLIVGFGFGSNPGRVVGLEKQIQQLTTENAELKSKLAVLPAPAPQIPATTPAAATTTGKK